MRYLALAEVLALHDRLIEQSGGSPGVRDMGGLQSAIAQPAASFGSEDLYPSLPEKASALAYSLIKNHSFVDGNKRVAHAAMETFLLLNGSELECAVDEQEAFWLALASSTRTRQDLVQWLLQHLRALPPSG